MKRFRFAFAAWLGCMAAAAFALSPADARHLLSRTGFGASPGEIAKLAPLDRDAAVASIIAGARMTPVTAPPDWADGLPNIPNGQFRNLPEAERQQKLKVLQRENRQRGQELKGWWCGEMLATDSPFTEHMTLFWHNHFTSAMQKVRAPQFMWKQNELYRREGLDNFDHLLHQVAKDPAMSEYLDGASNRRGAPNENFARELLELFTLGEGHYTENDIKAAARAFTGWGVDRQSGIFAYHQFQHDGGEKTFMGRSGRLNGDDIVTILLTNEQVSVHIVEKLWREFVSPDPDAAEVQKLAALFRNGSYEIKPLMQALLTCPQFWAAENRGVLVKSPLDIVIGTARTFSIRVVDPRELWQAARDQGQDLLDPPNVKGWPGGEAWIDSNSLMEREHFVSGSLTRIGEVKAAMMTQQGGEIDGASVKVASAGQTNMSGFFRPNQRGRGGNIAMEAALSANDDPWVQWLKEDNMKNLPQIKDVMLAIDPVEKHDDDVKLGKAIRHLATDPAYQLK